MVHGVLDALAWAGVAAAMRALHASFRASYRHGAPLGTARVLLVVFGFAFHSLALAQTPYLRHPLPCFAAGSHSRKIGWPLSQSFLRRHLLANTLSNRISQALKGRSVFLYIARQHFSPGFRFQ